MTLNTVEVQILSEICVVELKRIFQVAAQVRHYMSLVKLLTHWLGGGTVARNPCVSRAC